MKTAKTMFWTALLLYFLPTINSISVAADPVSCSISPLKKLMAMDRKAFEVREEPLMGHTMEGGALTILSRKGVPQRARAELFQETGKVLIDVGYLGGDVAV